MRLCRYYIPFILGLTLAVSAVSASAQLAVGVGISVPLAPPPLPVYTQPPIPGPGYLWTPGYWAYNAVGGYYWVPGTWVRPPAIGLLWTPPYWSFVGGVYTFNAGYWGPHVGFYGGINYGFGFGGIGFEGGFWQGGVFSYNTAVTNVSNSHITNVYNKTVVNNNTATRASFNGGTGVQAKPTAAEAAAANEPHTQPTAEQTSHMEAAKSNPALRASVNHGKPAVAATAKPGEFKGRGVVAAKAPGRGAASAAARAHHSGGHPTHPPAAHAAPHPAPAHRAVPHRMAPPHARHLAPASFRRSVPRGPSSAPRLRPGAYQRR